MISDKLYALAFEYKKTKLWKMLKDTDVFAVKMSHGGIGYISIMGRAGEHCAVGLYLGEEGFDSFRMIMKANETAMSSFEFQELFLQNNSLQCAFESKDRLSEGEREEAKKYARSHGIKITGKNAYPQFIKYQPNCLPWHLQTEQEEEELCEALAASIEMAKLLEEKTPETLGLRRITDETKEVPMLEQQNGVYVLGKAKIPKEKPKKFPTPKASNDIGIAKLKKIKKMGVWECGIVRCPQSVQNEQDQIPVFPLILLAVDSYTDYLLPVEPILDYEDNPEKFLNLFIEALISQHICPARLKVRDERTYTFAKAFCDKLKIGISIERELPVLDDVEYSFYEHIYTSGMEEMNHDMNMQERIQEVLDEVDDEQWEELPDEAIDMFITLMKQEGLPAEMEKEIKQVFQTKGTNNPKVIKPKKKTKKTASKQSYVISVSLGTGCYRHIQISCGSTLLELHGAILDAFGFVDDHAHAFFMDNKRWSGWDCYYMEGIEEDYRTTNRYNLNQAGLYKGKQFKYIFDFGDEWTFQCKVLRVVEETTDNPVVIKSKGEAPEQYEY